MQRKAKSTVIAEDKTETTAELLQNLDEETQEFGDLMSFLSELGSTESAHVSVYRDVKGSARGAYLFRCTPSEFSLADVMDKLRDEYDGGNFRVVVYANGQRCKNELVQVEGPKKSAFDFMNKGQPPAPAIPQNDLASALLQIQESMRAQSDSMRDMMLSQQQENTRMLLTVLEKSAGNNAPPQQTSLAELVQLLTVAQTIGGAKSDSSSSEKMLEMFFRGMDQGREQAGGEGDSVLVTAVKAFAPALADIAKLASSQAQPPQPLQQRQPEPKKIELNPAPGSQQLPIEANAADVNAIPDAAEAAKPYLQMLLNAAVVNGDPEVYANMLMDQVPQSLLSEWLESDMNYQMLLSYFPQEAKAVYPWFDSLRAIVLQFLGEEKLAGGEDAGQHGEDVPRGTGSEIQPNRDNSE